jgi:hypothetical protein
MSSLRPVDAFIWHEHRNRAAFVGKSEFVAVEFAADQRK